MPYTNLFESSTGLKIEVEGAESSAEAYAPALVEGITSLATVLAAKMADLPKSSRPDELQVSFGLKGLASGGFAVALDYDTASFRVTLKWGGEGTAMGAGALPMPKKPGF